MGKLVWARTHIYHITHISDAPLHLRMKMLFCVAKTLQPSTKEVPLPIAGGYFLKHSNIFGNAVH